MDWKKQYCENDYATQSNTVFMNWKNQYCENDYATQSNL